MKTQYAFPRDYRLLAKSDYSYVFAKPARAASKLGVCLARQNSHPYPRLGLAVSKKHYRRAVDRNRVKRLIRESFRQHKTMLPNCDIVFIARSGFTTLEPSQIPDALKVLWRRLNHAYASAHED